MKKEDLRIEKTKKALLRAFFDLIYEKSFEDITINELCLRANIRRATFYKHFADKYHFLTFTVKSLRMNFDERIRASEIRLTGVDYFKEYAKAVIDFLNENPITVKRILESELRSTLTDLIIEQNYLDTKAALDTCASNGFSLPAPSETVAVMLTGGIAHIIIRWLEGGKPKPQDTLTEEITMLIERILG